MQDKSSIDTMRKLRPTRSGSGCGAGFALVGRLGQWIKPDDGGDQGQFADEKKPESIYNHASSRY